MYKIMFSAGEASGDLHGAKLATELKKLYPQITMFGFGGNNMEKSGVKILKHLKDYSVMGFGEVLLNLRRMFSLKDYLVDVMKKEKPDILVIIDYPDFNWRLAKQAQKLNIPVFSFIPPTAWAWRKNRAKKCAKIANHIAGIFPFEIDVYKEAGANITYVGNPLKKEVVPSMTKLEAKEKYCQDKKKKSILLLPGSRKQEIEKILPTMLEAAKNIRQKHQAVEFHLPIASSLDKSFLQSYLEKVDVDIIIHEENSYNLMQSQDMAIATSGTVVLECALMNLPTVVVYKMSKFTYLLARLFVHIPYFSLPNIFLSKEVFPELLQNKANPENITKYAQDFLYNEETIKNCLLDLEELKDLMGNNNAYESVANLIIDTINEHNQTKREVIYE